MTGGVSMLRAKEGHLSTTLDDATVILDPSSGRYFSLDQVGALVWSLLHEGAPTTLDALEAAVLSRYDVDPERCRRDLHALVDTLVEAGLVERVGR